MSPAGYQNKDKGTAVSHDLVPMKFHQNLEDIASEGGDDQEKQKQQTKRQQFLSQLFSELNLVTIRLPTSAVRVGKNWMDSADGTMESIMSVLNISEDVNATQNSPSSSSQSASGLPLTHTSLEFNCIILGAKLVHHTTASGATL
jgi:hypothetical protein